MIQKNLFKTVAISALLSFPLSCDDSDDEQPKSEYSDKIESVTLLKTQNHGTEPFMPATLPDSRKFLFLKSLFPLLKH